jgi:hypothetical protein
MAALVKCPKGHWYEPDASGNPAVCPRCQAVAKSRAAGTAISDDDVLAILGSPKQAEVASEPSEEEPIVEKEMPKHTLQRHKKVCRACFFETSISFGHCPRCGGPLEIAMIEVL